MYSIDKLSPNHVYQTSIAYFHIQESEPSATSDQWHRMIVNVRQNLIPQHLIMTYMMKCEIKILMQGDEIKIIKYKMSS